MKKKEYWKQEYSLSEIKGEPKKYSKQEYPLSQMTDEQIEEKYEGDDALISMKKFEKIRFLIQGGFKELEKYKNEDISVFVGNTRSGKSTVINSLLGNTLFVEMKKKRAIISIAEDDIGPKIGNESVSETKMPTRYKTKDFGVIWDCPGYGDNRGDTQDIANNFCMKRLCENARSIKLFVISDAADIEKLGADGLISLTKSLDFSFGKDSRHPKNMCVLDKLMNNNAIGLIVTKSDDDDEYLKDLYKDDFLMAKGISKVPTADKLISYFINESKTMCVVPRVTEEYIEEYLGKRGVINDRLLIKPISSLFNSIESLDVGPGFSVRPGLSPSAQKFIYTYCNDEGMVKEFKNFFDFIRNKFSSYMKAFDYSSEYILKRLLVDIREKIESINKFDEDIDSINSLENLTKSLRDELPGFLDPMTEFGSQMFENCVKGYFEDHDLIAQAVFLDFLSESIVKVNNSLLKIVQKEISGLKSSYSQYENYICLQLDEIAKKEYEKKQKQLIKERDELKKQEQERLKQAKIFAKQQEENLIKKKAEQEKIKIEREKQLQKEKAEWKREQDKRAEEYKKMQEKLAFQKAEELRILEESRAKELADITRKMNEMAIQEQNIRDEIARQEQERIAAEQHAAAVAAHHAAVVRAKKLKIAKHKTKNKIKAAKKLKLKGGQDESDNESEDDEDMINLNDNKLMKEIGEKLGPKALNDFITLFSNLTHEEYDQIVSSDDVISKAHDVMELDSLNEELMKEIGKKLVPEVENILDYLHTIEDGELPNVVEQLCTSQDLI